MSQFPNPYGYGQYHGQHPPQPPLPPHPYGYPNVTGYAGPAYNSQYNSSAAMLNHDVAQASFQYNAAHIPGLGITGAAPGGSKYNPAAGPTTWPQHQVFPLPAQASAPGSSSGQHSQNTPPGLTVNNPSKSNSANPPTQTAPMTTLPATNTDIEEGELSEGQFEDLYEPRESVPNPVGQTVPKLLPIADRSQPTSAADTPEGGFYGTDEDDGEKASRGTEGTTSWLPDFELETNDLCCQVVNDLRLTRRFCPHGKFKVISRCHNPQPAREAYDRSQAMQLQTELSQTCNPPPGLLQTHPPVTPQPSPACLSDHCTKPKRRRRKPFCGCGP